MADEPRDDLMPYGVNTIRLRISFPATPVSQGYNGRMWRMRPLRGWTGGAEWDEEAAASAAAQGGADTAEALRGQASGGGLAQDVRLGPDAQHTQGGLFRFERFQDPVEQSLAALAAAHPLPGDRRLAANSLKNAVTDADASVAAGRDGGSGGASPMTPAASPSLDVTPLDAPIAAADPDPYASSDLRGATVRLGKVVITPPALVTADQLRAIMPHAGAEADRYVDALNGAMAAHGINTPEQRAAFLAQVSAESDNLRSVVEGLNYSSAQNVHKNWPSRFPTEAEAVPYLHHPETLANRAYAKRNGNHDEASGAGYRFRGRGLIQVTGRDNYRALGFENDPEALIKPHNAANSAAAYWQNRKLNDRATGVLDRAQLTP